MGVVGADEAPPKRTKRMRPRTNTLRPITSFLAMNPRTVGEREIQAASIIKKKKKKPNGCERDALPQMGLTVSYGFLSVKRMRV